MSKTITLYPNHLIITAIPDQLIHGETQKSYEYLQKEFGLSGISFLRFPFLGLGEDIEINM